MQVLKTDFIIKRFPGDKEIKKEMRDWLNDWISILSEAKLISFSAFPEKKEQLSAINRIEQMALLKAHILLFEALLFEPFFPIGKRIFEGLVKKTRNEELKLESRSHILKYFQDTKIETVLFKDIESLFDDGISKFRPSRLFERVAIGAVAAALVGITAGLAAPAIGAAIGGLWGLSGAAATSAGLAFLGGGALGANAFAFISSPKLFVRELAKLYVIIIKFIPLLEASQVEDVIEEINIGLRKFRNELREQISRVEKSKDQRELEQLSSLKETLECLEKFRLWIQEV